MTSSRNLRRISGNTCSHRLQGPRAWVSPSDATAPSPHLHKHCCRECSPPTTPAPKVQCVTAKFQTLHFPYMLLGDKLADLSIKKKKKLSIPRKIKGKVLGWPKSSPRIFCYVLWKNPNEPVAISIQKNKWGTAADGWLVRKTVCSLSPSFPSSSCLFSSFSCHGFLNSLNLFSLLSQPLLGEIFHFLFVILSSTEKTVDDLGQRVLGWVHKVFIFKAIRLLLN